jgi:hypothetical protein
VISIATVSAVLAAVLVGLLLVYLAFRLAGAAWYRSKQEFSNPGTVTTTNNEE